MTWRVRHKPHNGIITWLPAAAAAAAAAAASAAVASKEGAEPKTRET